MLKHRSTAICALVATAACSITMGVHARPLGADLSGDEILLEMDKRSATADAPGVYALSANGELRAVLTFGRHPQWSPDRNRIAYFHSGLIRIADLHERRSHGVDIQGSWVQCPSAGPLRNAAEWLHWTPDSMNVFGWQVRSVAMLGPPGEAFSAVSSPLDATVNASDVHIVPAFPSGMDGWRPPLGPAASSGVGLSGPVPGRQPHVGRISFAPDGHAVAFEALEFTAGVTLARCRVAIFSYVDGSLQEVEPQERNATVVMNPLWSPDGDSIAVDYVDGESLRRRVAVIDVRTMGTTVLDGSHSWLPHMTALQWSPSGDRLLLRETRDASGLGDSRLSVCRVSAPHPRAQVIGPPVTQACWSPNGDRIAGLCHDSSEEHAVTRAQIIVLSPQDERWTSVLSLSFDGPLIPIRLTW